MDSVKTCFRCMLKSISVLFYERLHLQDRTYKVRYEVGSLVIRLHAIYLSNDPKVTKNT